MGAVGIHAALLPNGLVLFWYYPHPFDTGNSIGLLWNPVTNAITQENVPWPIDVFCAGSIMLPNGNVMVIGGKNDMGGSDSDEGLTNITIFDWATSTWQQGPAMTYGRWYPGDVELPNGDVLAVSGIDAGGWNLTQQIERFSWANQSWSILPASANIALQTSTYPRVIVTTDGNVFEAGQELNNLSLNPNTNTWSTVTNASIWPRFYGSSVLLPGLTQVLSVGGGLTDTDSRVATNSVSIMNYPSGGWVDGCGLNQPANTTCVPVTSGGPAPMSIQRENLNLVLLPDGTVMAEGGGQGCLAAPCTGSYKYSNPVLYPEDYDPVANTWTPWSSQQVQRTYHSTALLLPDGRVVSAGSDNGTQLTTLEVFSPPYLSAGSRPTITSAPTSLSYGQQFTITTPNAASISLVALIKAESTTHATRFDARYVTLACTAGSGQLTCTAPASGNVAPPGYYMLDVLMNGVPAVMPFVQVGSTGAPAVSFAPGSLAFGSQAVGTSSSAQVVTLSNTGSAALSITGVNIGPDFAQTNNCGSTVAAGGSCTFNVTFTPTTLGTLNESLTVTDNASGSPQSVSLSGTGTAPAVTLS
ncbi:MAG TPA: galactose oxidase-like domain-containing protein, partial [Terriglobia bacterium]|nr:galactose oxidase-like domain-containing protein [Terriglobia bacterium]